MSNRTDNANCKEEWKQRFEAVGRAQGRYLYVLLLSGVFFWALHWHLIGTDREKISNQELPLVGIAVDSVIVWASAPIVLGATLLAALGTFPAIKKAHDNFGNGDEDFERRDLHPTAIDFIVYGEGPFRLLSYPAFLSLVFVEASWIWFCFFKSDLDFLGRRVFLTVGAIILLWCFPRLLRFWYSKSRSMLHEMICKDCSRKPREQAGQPPNNGAR